MTAIGENGLLKQLRPDDLATLHPNLKPFSMACGMVLHQAMRAIDHVYFPLSGMISILAVMRTGEQIETGIVGREGVIGASIGSFGPNAYGQATVQIPGSALRIHRDSFLKAFNGSESFRRSMNGFQAVILFQAQQSAACHALHSVEQRFCRWLLQSQDVVESDTIPLTHEFLSRMLGVQRTGITLRARELQKRGLIDYTRANIRILDRAAVAKAACECYEDIHAAVNRQGSRRGAWS